MGTNSHRSSDRGAVVIQMAVCMLVLLAFTAFVVDYGVMWASRGQAQTSADAGALAGATSLAFDSMTDFAGARLKA
jgi:Flp pilus assembly protein TadG